MKRLTGMFLKLILTWAVLTPASAEACRGRALVLNRPDRAVVFCYDKRLKSYLSSDCFQIRDGKSCDIRSVILKNRYSPVKLSASELQTTDNPDATACDKLKQNVRELIDSEGIRQIFCESKRDGSLAPLHLFRWRT